MVPCCGQLKGSMQYNRLHAVPFYHPERDWNLVLSGTDSLLEFENTCVLYSSATSAGFTSELIAKKFCSLKKLYSHLLYTLDRGLP